MFKSVHNISKETERTVIPYDRLEKYFLTLLIVATATIAMFLIGRDILGEGVIALLYLAPISWITARWGQGPGIVAAVASALAFDFLFIPPYFTLTVGSLEGWLLLGIFLAVAIVVVGRIQVGLKQAQAREHEAILMYELSAELARARTREAVVHTLATKVQQLHQAELVQVTVEGEDNPLIISIPAETIEKRKPDHVIPIMAARGLIGEVRLWLSEFSLPLADDRLLINFSDQSALALEQAHRIKTGDHPSS